MTTTAERFAARMAARVTLIMMQAELTLDANRVRLAREADPKLHIPLTNQLTAMQERIDAIDLALVALL